MCNHVLRELHIYSCINICITFFALHAKNVIKTMHTVHTYVHTYIQFCSLKCPLKNPFSFCYRHPVASINRYQLVYHQTEHITFNTIHMPNAICFCRNTQPIHVVVDKCAMFELLFFSVIIKKQISKPILAHS